MCQWLMIPKMKNPQSVTIKDVARLAGVSISTASRALAGAGGVSGFLEARISESAAKLGYRPNAAARGLRKSRTSTLGIVFNNLSGPGQLELLKGIGNSCTNAGFSLLSADANGDHDLYLAQIARFFEQRVEGIFLVSPINLGESLADYRRFGVPVIALLRKDASAGTTTLVAASERHGIRDAVEELVGLGHRNIAYFLRFWDDRRVGEVEEALWTAGLRASPYSLALKVESTREVVAEAVGRALLSHDRPTAMLVHSSLLGPILRVTYELNLKLPDDLSLASLGSSSWQGVMTPGLSGVEVDSQAIGRLACQVMISWLEGSEPKLAYSELARWVRRGSVGSVPTGPLG